MRRRWSKLAWGLGALLIAGGAYRGIDEWRFRAEREEAGREVAQGRMTRALPRLAALATRRPGDGEVLYQLGVCEQALGRLPAALDAWGRVPAGSAFAGRAGVNLARQALRTHRLAEAEVLMARALGDTGPHAVEALETLVHLWKIEGRYEEVRRLLRATWDRYPDRIGVLKELAQVDSIKPYALDRARIALERASAAAPEDDRIWLGWANLATRTGKFDDAARWLDRCQSRRPDDPAVWRARLNLAMASQTPEGVRQALEHLPGEALSPAEVLNLRAWFAGRAGDDAAERQGLRDLLAIDPANLRGIERLAELELRAGDAAGAATLRARKSELDRAKAQYEIILFFLDDAATRPAEMARFAETLARPLEARMFWNMALTRHPGDPEATEGLTRVESLAASAASPRASLASLLADLHAAKPAGPTKPAAASGLVMPRFVDDAEAAGLKFTFDSGMSPLRHLPETMSGGIGLIDFDGDGWLDVYCVQGGTFPPSAEKPSTGDRLFRNKRDGTFEDATARSGIAAMPRGYGHGVAVGDYDNDGRPDLFVTRWRSYALYRNKGDGTFEDATAKAGLSGDRDWPTSAAFADLDNDGDLDLYVCHYLVWDSDNPTPCTDPKRPGYVYCGPPRFPSLPDHVFKNNDGKFIDVTRESGFTDTHGQGLGVVACDFDGDGRVDVFVANDQTANYLYHNLGGFKVEEIGEAAGVASSADGVYQASMGVVAGDPDGDGRPDLVVTNFYNEGTTLYHNLGGMAFADHTTATGLMVATRYMLGFGVALFDVNADGLLDIASTNGHVDDFRPDEPYAMPAQLLLGSSGGRKFTDATRQAGPAWSVERLGRGLAAGDLDNDGRIDLVILAQNSPVAFFHNRTEGGGHWLTLGLEGTRSNRDAVGAKVTITAGGRERVAWRVGGGSYQSASSPLLHFGLGEAAEIEDVEVAWPSGGVEHFGRLKADGGFRLREGDGAARPLAGYGR